MSVICGIGSGETTDYLRFSRDSKESPGRPEGCSHHMAGGGLMSQGGVRSGPRFEESLLSGAEWSRRALGVHLR